MVTITLYENSDDFSTVLCNHSGTSDSLRPYGLQPARLFHPGGSPGQSSGVCAMPSPRIPSQPRNRTQVSCIAGRFFTDCYQLLATNYTEAQLLATNYTGAQLFQ